MERLKTQLKMFRGRYGDVITYKQYEVNFFHVMIFWSMTIIMQWHPRSTTNDIFTEFSEFSQNICNGVRLVEFCSENGMVITGTIFEHKNIHKTIWTSPDHNSNNQINHILVNRKCRRSILDTKARRGQILVVTIR